MSVIFSLLRDHAGSTPSTPSKGLYPTLPTPAVPVLDAPGRSPEDEPLAARDGWCEALGVIESPVPSSPRSDDSSGESLAGGSTMDRGVSAAHLDSRTVFFEIECSFDGNSQNPPSCAVTTSLACVGNEESGSLTSCWWLSNAVATPRSAKIWHSLHVSIDVADSVMNIEGVRFVGSNEIQVVFCAIAGRFVLPLKLAGCFCDV